MGGAVSLALTSLVTGVTWCFCTAMASLLGACCGNDKPSTVPPSVSSGRKRSVLLLIMTIGLALGFQYGVAPAILQAPSILDYLRDCWTSGCEVYAGSLALMEACAANSGVYRPCFAAIVFFLLCGVTVACKPSFNREVWPAKYVLFLFLVLATVFIPNNPLFDQVFLNIGRIGGVVFIFVQQLVIVDLAHNWNESWVTKADDCEKEEEGTGKKWLAAVLISCALLFIVSIAGIVTMFVHFTGCATNTAFISTTLVLCILITVAQMTGEDGSLLSSACVSAWAVYLCYSAVTKNPNGVCNPALGDPNGLAIALGLVITIVGMGWTGWSYTAEDKVTFGTGAGEDEETAAVPAATNTGSDSPTKDEGRKVAGHVTGTNYGTDGQTYVQAPDDGAEERGSESENNPKQLSNSWRLNLILATIACFSAMVLTQWGEIKAEGTVANPAVGNVGMWMVMASQWVALVLYLWTLIAPRVFPDRDFS